jgi:hypothetical protein
MQLNAEKIRSLQEEQGAVYWTVRDINKRSVGNRQDQEIDLETSVEKLYNYLTSLEGNDLVLVSLYTTVPGKRVKGQEYDTGIEIKFRPASNSVNPGNISGIGLKDYLELKDQIAKSEIERIKRDIEAEQKPTFLEKMLNSNQGQQLIGALINFMQPKPQPQPQPIKGNKLEEALELIREQGEDPEHLIICLAKYASKNPGVLQTIKPIIGA